MRRIGGLLVAVGVLWSGVAHAQDAAYEARIAEARALFEQAQGHYDNGFFETAAEEFSRAHALMEGHANQYLVLFNVAQAHKGAGEWQAAIDAFEAYLTEGGDRIENRGEVQTLIRECREAMGDGGPPETPSGPDPALLGGAIAALSVGGLGFGAMGILGGLALAEHDELADGCGATMTCAPEDIATSDDLALGADIALIIGGAAAAAGVVLLVVALTSGGDDEALTLAPFITPTAGGVAVRGSL